MQLLQRPSVIKFVMPAVLICGHCAVGHTEITSSDSDIQQIRDTFNVPDDDHGVLKATKRVYESDEHPMGRILGNGWIPA